MVESRRRTKFVVLLTVLLVAGFSLLLYQVTRNSQIDSASETSTNGNTSNSVTSNSRVTMARYEVNSPTTGQWLVVKAVYPIVSVSASDTGTIPVFHSLVGLNQTLIGEVCSKTASDGACDSFAYVQQTGWFWDSVGHTLTVHYLGGANVTLTVVEQP